MTDMDKCGAECEIYSHTFNRCSYEEDIRADERVKVIEDVHKAMANKYHCKEDMCEVGMTCADCLKAYMEDLYSNK